MATVTSPVRVPFGVLNESRLRSLTNMKNKQNALASPATTLGKRRYQPEADPAFDAENVDPVLFINKKAKNASSDFTKPSLFTLKTTATGPALTPTTRQTITPKRLIKKSLDTKPISFSAPAAPLPPAGRSPQRKRAGILGHRRTSGSGFARVDPPAFNLGRSGGSSLPFSIDSALSGTGLARAAAKPKHVAPAPVSRDTIMTLENTPPSSWVFDIHEDTPDEELGNLMQHSTQNLDLSDDEERQARLLAEVGKENIAPPEYTGRQRAIARRDMMLDTVRTPLGDLKPADFYAEGCDANSFIIVDDGKSQKPVHAMPKLEVAVVPELPALNTAVATSASPVEAGSTHQDELRELFASIDRRSSETPAMTEDEVPKVDIWESESANGDETEQRSPITTTASLEASLATAMAHEEAAIEAAT